MEEEDTVCKFCGDVVENPSEENVITVTFGGFMLAGEHLCDACKKALLRDMDFRCDAIGALAYEIDNNLWNEFCMACPYEDGCEIPSVFNCPSIRKAIAEETE